MNCLAGSPPTITKIPSLYFTRRNWQRISINGRKTDLNNEGAREAFIILSPPNVVVVFIIVKR